MIRLAIWLFAWPLLLAVAFVRAHDAVVPAWAARIADAGKQGLAPVSA